MIKELPKKLKILVVDDDSIMRASHLKMLKNLGIDRVVESDNIVKAKEILAEEFNKAEPVHLIMCDHHMPGGLGIQFITYVRTSLKFKNLGFITITSDASRPVVLPNISAGADSFIIKPVNEKDLLNKLLQVVSKRNIDPNLL